MQQSCAASATGAVRQQADSHTAGQEKQASADREHEPDADGGGEHARGSDREQPSRLPGDVQEREGPSPQRLGNAALDHRLEGDGAGRRVEAVDKEQRSADGTTAEQSEGDVARSSHQISGTDDTRGAASQRNRGDERTDQRPSADSGKPDSISTPPRP